jgi:hypothetical protein
MRVKAVTERPISRFATDISIREGRVAMSAIVFHAAAAQLVGSSGEPAIDQLVSQDGAKESRTGTVFTFFRFLLRRISFPIACYDSTT